MLKKMPIPICGVILGLYGLGNLLQSYSEGVRMACGVVATILLILFIISVIADFGKFKENMKNPIMATVFATFPMALMLCSVYFKPWLKGVSTVIWYLAFAIHVVLIIYVTAKYIVKLDLAKIFASYFIVYAGIAMIAMTAPAYEATGLGTVTFWFGLITVIIMMIIATVRYANIPAPDPAKPLICIYSAPISLCIAGYIQSVMPKSLPLPFFPSYAAYTFPFVIAAIASKQLMMCSMNMGSPMPFLKPIVLIETIIATITTLYAFVRYLMFLFAPAK